MEENEAQWALARKLLPNGTQEELAKAVAGMVKNLRGAADRLQAEDAELRKFMEKYKDPV